MRSAWICNGLLNFTAVFRDRIAHVMSKGMHL